MPGRTTETALNGAAPSSARRPAREAALALIGSSDRRRRRRTLALDRREQVLQAAERLFARHGYEGVGLREIAHEVGIRAPSLFKHFPSKQAIYNLVLGDLFSSLAAAIDAAIGGPGDYARRLDGLVTAYVDFLVLRPHFPAILFREMLDHPRALEQLTSARGVEIYARLEAFLRGGRRAGVFRPVSARHLIFGFTGMVTFFHASQSELARLDTMAGARPRELQLWKREVVAMMRRSLLVEASRPAARRTRRRRVTAPATESTAGS